MGARLEAEDTLQKQRQTRAGSVIERAGAASSNASPRDTDTTTTITSTATTESSVAPLNARALSALRRRELELGSPVAILDERMTRARPAGLLVAAAAAATSVSVDALVTSSSSSSHPLTKATIGGGGNHYAVGGSRRTAATRTAASPDQHRCDRRLLSLPLRVPIDVGESEGKDKEGPVGGGMDARRRPWTTSCRDHQAGAWASEHDEGGGGDGRILGLKELSPCRFGHV